jgi:hypothetical protein
VLGFYLLWSPAVASPATTKRKPEKARCIVSPTGEPKNRPASEGDLYEKEDGALPRLDERVRGHGKESRPRKRPAVPSWRHPASGQRKAQSSVCLKIVAGVSPSTRPGCWEPAAAGA